MLSTVEFCVGVKTKYIFGSKVTNRSALIGVDPRPILSFCSVESRYFQFKFLQRNHRFPLTHRINSPDIRYSKVAMSSRRALLSARANGRAGRGGACGTRRRSIRAP